MTIEEVNEGICECSNELRELKDELERAKAYPSLSRRAKLRYEIFQMRIKLETFNFLLFIDSHF
jgi:hypothetical protein